MARREIGRLEYSPVQVTRIYLELRTPAAFCPPPGEAPALVVARARAPTPTSYRHLYRTVGQPYHWHDRASWTDAELRAHLARPEISLHVAHWHGALAGWYELRAVPQDGSVEIAYFGLVPAVVGRGVGKHLLARAVEDAWQRGAGRVWLHTCTLDHPHALPNYRARGFIEYRTEHYEFTPGEA